jgi:glycosyltransferase involved in cell wall biosynthesis
MQKQKICHIINSLDFGGIETIVRDFSNYDPTVNVIIFQKKGSDIFTETVDSNVPVYFVKSGWFNCIKILKIMKAHNCNKICSHVFSNIFEMILLHFLSSTQILQVLHSEYQLNLLSKLKNIIAYRLALFFGIKVICVSNGVAQYALNNLKLHNVSVIYNGIDASKFYYDTTKRHDKFIVVHIGSFTYPKNHKLLIKIFHEFYLTNSNARLRLVGDGALLDDIKKQVRTCGLEEVVEFCGAVVDVPNCISGGSVFLFPSLSL